MCDVKLTGEDWIKYANDWHSQEMAKAVPSVDIERICEKVHQAYCKYHLENKGTEYWTKGDYNKLSEEGKEYDRRTVRAVLDALCEGKGGEK